MNKRVKDLWLKALRSGDYPQTKGALANEYGFCCLGVLCKIAESEGIVTSRSGTGAAEGSVIFTSTTDADDSNDLLLPHAVMNWAGINRDSPTAVWTEDRDLVPTHRHLPTENDGGATFVEIAEMIEKGL